MKNFNIILGTRTRLICANWILSLFLGLSVALTYGPRPVLAETISLMLYGDSLMAGYGLVQQEGFQAQLQTYLNQHKADLGLSEEIDIRLLNASVSGDTSAAGLARLDWSLQKIPDLVLLELGANDGLRGLAPAQMAQNLADILARFKQEKVAILLAGMLAPPNMGPDYAAEYNAVFSQLGQDPDIIFYSFFLDGVVGQPKYNQADGMHPNESGVAIIVERIAPYIARLIKTYQVRHRTKG